MKVSISKEIQKDAGLTIVVGKINYILTEVVGNAWDQVEAKWEMAGDPRTRILFLNLWLEDQATGTTIHPSELDNPNQLKSKLREVWGDLLQVRLDGIVARLKATVREEVGS